MNKIENYVVLSEKEIKQKLAGYKSAYTKRVKAAKTAKERKALEANRESFISAIEENMRNENKKMIQRRAGHLSWETRRANQTKVVHTKDTTCKKSLSAKKSNKKTCCCSVKVSKKNK